MVPLEAVDAHALRARHGKHAKRVAVPQVTFGSERKLGQVSQRVALVGAHTGFVKLGLVNRRVGVGVAQGGLHALELQCTQLCYGSFFDGL